MLDVNDASIPRAGGCSNPCRFAERNQPSGIDRQPVDLPDACTANVYHQDALEDLAFDLDVLELRSTAPQTKRLFDALAIKKALPMLLCNKRCFANDIGDIAEVDRDLVFVFGTFDCPLDEGCHTGWACVEDVFFLAQPSDKASEVLQHFLTAVGFVIELRGNLEHFGEVFLQCSKCQVGLVIPEHNDLDVDINKLWLERGTTRFRGLDLELAIEQNPPQCLPHLGVAQYIAGIDDEVPAVGAQNCSCFDHRKVTSNNALAIVVTLDRSEEIGVRRERLDDDWRRARFGVVHDDVDGVLLELIRKGAAVGQFCLRSTAELRREKLNVLDKVALAVVEIFGHCLLFCKASAEFVECGSNDDTCGFACVIEQSLLEGALHFLSAIRH
ncbi:hypothetical protein HRbin20_00910 [bacterium HR20]|nr:hypothetical protein HRbin20_00910 [bacterium HR20]